MSHTLSSSQQPQPQPRPEYPRPDFDRNSRSPESWLNLNGPWSFEFDDKDQGVDLKWYTRHAADNDWGHHRIVVPFAFQYPLSTIPAEFGADHQVMWYAKDVPWDINLDSAASSNLLLRFGCVDYHSTIWINGHYVASHTGVHSSFDVDITDTLKNTTKLGDLFTITVRVVDRLADKTQPRGKQYWKPKPQGIYYTPSSGILGTVWLERVPGTRIQQTKITPDLDNKSFNIHAEVLNLQKLPAGAKAKFVVTASLAGKEVSSVGVNVSNDTCTADLVLPLATGIGAKLSDSSLEAIQEGLPSGLFTPEQLQTAVQPDGTAIWSPDHPVLYDLQLDLLDSSGQRVDHVKTQAGLRKVSISSDGLFLLNNEPYYQRLALDQGYWPDGGLTAPDDSSFITDIVKTKQMGLNGVRKHQKNEDPRWLYWTDKLGLLVWSEFANAQDFSVEYVQRFTTEWVETLKRDWNHTSIIVWTPINESWGVPDVARSTAQQAHLKSIYHLTKSLDSSRLVVDNDGWEHVTTDLLTVHDYNPSETLRTTLSSIKGILSSKGDPNDQKQVLLHHHEQNTDKPILLSEFGGINLSSTTQSHATATVDESGESWGYHTVSDSREYLAMLKELIQVILASKHIQGFCYTQLTDTHQETNGLLKKDRSDKVPLQDLYQIFSMPHTHSRNLG
ncbi:unnamed protein product [Sympodiomycopsis kandeliae]